jgi:hypothetical protein
MASSAPACRNKRQPAGLVKFAGELSGARHFKLPLYPIEGHLAQRGLWPTGLLDGVQRRGANFVHTRGTTHP